MINPERQFLRRGYHPFYAGLARNIADFMRVAEDGRRAEWQHRFGKAAWSQQAGFDVHMRIDQAWHDNTPSQVAGFRSLDSRRRAALFYCDKAPVSDANPALEEPITEDIGNPSVNQKQCRVPLGCRFQQLHRSQRGTDGLLFTLHVQRLLFCERGLLFQEYVGIGGDHAADFRAPVRADDKQR